MIFVTLQPYHQSVSGQFAQQLIAGIVWVCPFADGSAGIADEMGVLIQPLRSVDEILGVQQGMNFSQAKLLLSAAVL